MRASLLLCATLLAACAGKPQPAPDDALQASMDSLRAAVPAAIKDPARAREPAAIVDQVREQYRQAIAATRSHVTRLRELDADYDATLADFRQVLADYNGGREERRARLLELRDRLIAATTEAEWENLVEAHREALALLLTGSSRMTPLTGWLDKGRTYVKDQVGNPVQRNAALDAMDEIEDGQEALRKAEERAARAIGRLVENRKASAGDFQPALATLRAETRAVQEKMLLARFRAKSLVIREQWVATHLF
jgi:hypothetical protein